MLPPTKINFCAIPHNKNDYTKKNVDNSSYFLASPSSYPLYIELLLIIEYVA